MSMHQSSRSSTSHAHARLHEHITPLLWVWIRIPFLHHCHKLGVIDPSILQEKHILEQRASAYMRMWLVQEAQKYESRLNRDCTLLLTKILPFFHSICSEKKVKFLALYFSLTLSESASAMMSLIS